MKSSVQGALGAINTLKYAAEHARFPHARRSSEERQRHLREHRLDGEQQHGVHDVVTVNVAATNLSEIVACREISLISIYRPTCVHGEHFASRRPTGSREGSRSDCPTRA